MEDKLIQARNLQMLSYMRSIEDATKRIGDRVVSLISSGELKIDDSYIEMQMQHINTVNEQIQEMLGGTKDE